MPKVNTEGTGKSQLRKKGSGATQRTQPEQGNSTPKIVGLYRQDPSGQWWHTSGSHGLLIVTRSEPTPKKPATYLLLIRTDGHRQYISSLYPSGTANVWRIEYRKIRYRFILTADGQVKVEPTEEGGANSGVYHMEFGSQSGHTDKGGRV